VTIDRIDHGLEPFAGLKLDGRFRIMGVKTLTTLNFINV